MVDIVTRVNNVVNGFVWGPVMLVLHMVLAIVGLLFICAHIYLCTLGDTPGQIFRSMIDGYHRHRTHHAETAPRKG